MPKQEPFERIKNFDEVALGTPRIGREESGPLPQMQKPTCRQGLPGGIKIPKFIPVYHGRQF